MKKIFLGGDFSDDLRLKLSPFLTVRYGDIFVYDPYTSNEYGRGYKHRIYVITPTTNIELRRGITECASKYPNDVTLMFIQDKNTFRPNHRRIYAPLTNLIGTVRSTVKGDVQDLADILNNVHRRYS